MLRLLNRYEEIAHGEIKQSADRWGLSVFPKVRVADVIPLEEVGAKSELKRYGLQSHFDFVICKEAWEPIYAIEFDGRFHSTPIQKARDTKKDELCRRADFPILRINSKYLSKEFGSMSLVAWIMDVFELQKGFFEAQDDGSIPPDEPFDPFFMMSVEPDGEQFPYWFSARPRIRLMRLHESGKIAKQFSSGLIGYDDQNVLRGTEYIQVTRSEGIVVRTAMRPQQFPILLSDLLEEILFVQLSTEVQKWIEGAVGATSLKKIYRDIEVEKASWKQLRSHCTRRAGQTD